MEPIPDDTAQAAKPARRSYGTRFATALGRIACVIMVLLVALDFVSPGVSIFDFSEPIEGIGAQFIGLVLASGIFALPVAVIAAFFMR